MATDVPSMKGSGIQSVFDDLLALERSGRLRPEQMSERLRDDDLRLLRQPVDPARWYPLATYERMMKLLIEVEGCSDYLERRGRAVTERLMKAGIYPQLELAERLDAKRLEAHLLRNVRLMASVFGAMLNRAELTAQEDPAHGLVLEIKQAGELPEMLGEVILGMVRSLAERIGFSDPPFRLVRVSSHHWRYLRR